MSGSIGKCLAISALALSAVACTVTVETDLTQTAVEAEPNAIEISSVESPPSIWEEFGIDEPDNGAVLFWSQTERDAGFRKLDELPEGFIGVNPIAAGDRVKDLPQGEPLSIEAEIDDYLIANNHSGIVILHDGKVRYENYGLKMTPQNRWTSFSVAKAFTSTLVGAAIKDGYIESLDAPVTDYIPNLTGSAYDGVTVEQLITMSSGVAWNEDYADPQSDINQSGQHVPEEGMLQVVSYLRTKERAHPAGEVWNYSTAETNLVGILLSQSIDRSLSSYLSEKIWAPYGMEADATWLSGERGLEIGGCCIQARVRDFARYGQFMLEGAKIEGEAIVPDGWIEKATNGRFDVPIGNEGLQYAYQWLVYPDGTYGHFGIFGQGLIIDPSRNLIIASNGSWQDARGEVAGQMAAREVFHQMVKDAIDAEGSIQ